MNRKRDLFWMLLLLALAPVFAASPELPQARVLAVQAPVQLDGVLDEAFWALAPVQAGFNALGKRKNQPQRTEFRLVFADGALVIGVSCYEAEMDKLQANARQRDAGQVCSDDSVEVFLVPGNGYYYQFAVNVGGYLYDGRREARTDLTPDAMRDGLFWDGAWEAAVSRGAEMWSAEIRIPLAILDQAGGMQDVWHLNVARTESRGGYSSWAPVNKGYHDLECYGTLQGLPAAAGRFFDAANLEFPAFLVGRNRLDINIPALAEATGTYVIRSSLREWEPGRLPERSVRQEQVRVLGGVLPVEMEVPVTKAAVMHELVLEVAEAESGKPVLLKTHLFRSPAPLAAEAPWTLFFSGDRQAVIRCQVKLAAHSGGGTLTLQVFRAGQAKAVYSRRQHLGGSGEVLLPVALRHLRDDGVYAAELSLECAGTGTFTDTVSFFKLSGRLP